MNTSELPSNYESLELIEKQKSIKNFRVVDILFLLLTFLSIGINLYYFNMFQQHIDNLPSASSINNLNHTLQNVTNLEQKFNKLFNYLCKEYKICI